MRSFIFIIWCGVSFVLPLWVFALGVVLYAARWFALELLVLAAIIDVVFSPTLVPWYTLSTVLIMCAVEWSKSILTVY